MIEFLKSWVINIVFVVVLVSLIELLLPNSSIKRYVNVIIGMIIIIVILSPVISVINRNLDMNINVFNSFYKLNAQSSRLLTQLDNAGDREIFINEYKRRLSESLRDYIKKEFSFDSDVDLVINEDLSSQNFGMINHITIMLKKNEGNIIPVEKVEIGSKDENKREDSETTLTQKEKEMIRRISALYGIDIKNISVIKEK